ncbi:MAG: SDR family NAD(P)-dependent oxidoreductase [Anaerolineaceae bacterium]|nr:SDR family NAD(P)-dependent oxidoreductase [Anaerolineaceae bacterium]
MKNYVMITGATGGLGSAFTAECASRGFDLVLTDLKPEGQEFAKRIAERYGVEVNYYPCDLYSETARTELFAQLRADGRKFWSLINVAGLDFEGEYLGRSRSQILTVLNVNLVANMDMTHEILQMRDENQKFRLINTCSMAAFYPMPFKATYAATKRFLLDFSLAFREEIRNFGTVTALAPGGMPTTPECMRAIFVQGFWGWATTLDPQIVARSAIKAALKGRAVCIPGWANKLVNFLGSLVPVGLKVRFVASRWNSTQSNIAQQDFLAGRLVTTKTMG